MFISRVLLVLFALLATTVIAAPVWHERSLEELQLSARGFRQIKQAVGIALKLKKNLRPAPHQAVFWSGTKSSKHGPVSVGADAQHFAHAHGKEVLNNESLKKHGINIPSRKDSPYSTRLWKIASKVYAQRASGDVHAILGSARRPGNVYDTIEKPALLKNKKVTKLTEHNAETGKTTIVK
jgi:hypothetical protein